MCVTKLRKDSAGIQRLTLGSSYRGTEYNDLSLPGSMGVRSFAEYGNGPLGFGGVYGRTESGACSALEAAIAPPRNEIERIVFLYTGNRGISENIRHQVIMLWMEDNAPSAFESR